MLKTAILSMWHVHAQEYAKFVSEQPDAEISCVWDDDAERGRKAAAEFGVDFVPDLDKALARSDAVVVASPTSDHHDIMVKAANAKKHIFTEKVLAPTVAQAWVIAAAIRDAGIIFAISFPHLRNGTIQHAKKLMDGGLLGRVTNFRARNVHGGCEWLPPHWYNMDKACGGAMMDLGAHPNYLAAYFLGKPARIAAIFNNTACPEGVDDNTVAVVEFENKAIAVIETGFVTPRSANTVEIEGTDGALVIEGGRLRTNSRKSKEEGWVFAEPEDLPAQQPPILRQWMDAILYGKELPEYYGLEPAFTLSVLTENEYMANREGRIVTV
jgi:predicted dehydrogenase